MNITLDHDTISSAIQTAVSDAVQSGVGSYDIQRRIRETAAEAILAADLPGMVRASVEQQLQEQSRDIVARITAGVAPVIVAAMTMSVRRHMCELMVSLESARDYLTCEQRGARVQTLMEEMAGAET